MSLLILRQEKSSQKLSTKNITSEQLKELLTQLQEQNKKIEDVVCLKNIIQILKLLKIQQVGIEMIEQVNAEKQLRNLITQYGCDPFHQYNNEHQIIKSLSRELLLQWSQLRKTKLFNEGKLSLQKSINDKIEIFQPENVPLFIDLESTQIKSNFLNIDKKEKKKKEITGYQNLVLKTKRCITTQSSSKIIIDDEIYQHSLKKQSQNAACESQSLKQVQPQCSQIFQSITGTGYQFRDTLRQKLVDLFVEQSKSQEIISELKIQNKKNDLKSSFLIDIALRIEQEMFKIFKCGKPYYDKSRSLIFNLSDKKNKMPILALLKKQVTPEEFVSTDMRELASNELKQQRENAQQIGMWNKRTDWNKEQVKQQVDFKGMFKCENCGSDKTGFIQIQIERADEPMTNFVFCYDCQQRYKF